MIYRPSLLRVRIDLLLSPLIFLRLVCPETNDPHSHLYRAPVDNLSHMVTEGPYLFTASGPIGLFQYYESKVHHLYHASFLFSRKRQLSLTLFCV